MDFHLTQAQQDLKSTARRFLANRCPLSCVASDGAGAASWAELAGLGWCDADLGLVELALLAQESGRALLAQPWLATAAFALPVYQAADVAPPDPATFVDSSDTCRAEATADGWRLNGEAHLVVDAVSVSEVLVAATSADGIAVFGVRTDAPGVEPTRPESIDRTRIMSDIDFRDAEARLLVAPPVGNLVGSIEQRASVLFACEGVGVGDRALELAVEHAKTRVQFDRPIGSYQAVAHRLSDVYAELELARSLAYRAAAVLDGRSHDTSATATACAVHAARRAAITACEVAIQTFGGMGVTWEFPLHRWYRRALWLDAYHCKAPDPLDVVAYAVLDQGERHDTGPTLVPAVPR